MRTNQRVIIIAISLLALASVAVCLEETKTEGSTTEYQTYEYGSSVVKASVSSSGTSTDYVFLGNGSKIYNNTYETNTTITNDVQWDTSKILRTSNNLRLGYDGLCNTNDSSFNVTIQMKMIAGTYTSVHNVSANTVFNAAESYTFEAGGLEGILKLAKPNSTSYYDSINFYKSNGTPVDFLKVTDPEIFKTVPSPVVFQITVGEGDAAFTSEIQVNFDDSSHTNPDTGSDVTISSEIKNGYSVLDVSVGSTYAGTDNYLLAIAKYEESIVYNSYLKVPSSVESTVRMAFSNEGLKEVVIEIVSSNEAFGDSVPEYLAYETYVPS